MATIIPGTLLIHNGTKIIPLNPSGEDGMALTFDSTAPSKLKWAPTGKSFKLNLPPTNTITTTSYVTVTEFSLSEGEYTSLDNIKIVSYMSRGVESYDIRIYDSTNNNILAEETYKNTEKEIQTISKFDNMPKGNVIMEVQCRKGKGWGWNSSVIIKDIDIFYI